MKVGVLHPGEMGSSIGAQLARAGHSAFWVARGRSPATAQRAAADGLETLATLDELVSSVDIIISICPPHAAVDQAQAVNSAGFRGLYVDANAVGVETLRAVQTALGETVDFVDGGVIGPPARQDGSTRLYLAGDRAQDVAALFRDSALQAIPLEAGPGAASVLKMCYAAWTKGSAALLMAVAALARRENVEEPLMGEWQLSLPELPAKLQHVLDLNAPKAWRFEGEMHEIASTFQRAGMPEGFHLSAAEIYRRLAAAHALSPDDCAAILSLLSASDTK